MKSLIKTKQQRAVDELLALAKKLSDDEPTWAITYLMAAAIFLQKQIELPKDLFVEGAMQQWDDIEAFMDNRILIGQTQSMIDRGRR